jgi:hypothetical protein
MNLHGAAYYFMGQIFKLHALKLPFVAICLN